jgi:hypothetical protein
LSKRGEKSLNKDFLLKKISESFGRILSTWFAGTCCWLRFIDFQDMFAGFTGCTYPKGMICPKGKIYHSLCLGTAWLTADG